MLRNWYEGFKCFGFRSSKMRFQVTRIFMTQVLFVMLICGLLPDVHPEVTCPAKFGYFPDPNDCQGYYICTFGNAKTRKCGNSLHYKTTSQTCDKPKADNCMQEDNQASRPKYTGMMMKVSETTTGTMPSNAASLPNESTAADDRNLPSVMSTEASVAQEYPLNQGPPSNSFSRSGTAPQSNQDSAENPSDAARPASPLDARLTPQNSLQKNPNQNLGSRQGNKNKDSFQSNRDKEGPVAERSPSLPQADQSFIPQNSGQRNPNQNFGPAENNKNKDFSRPSYQKEQKNVQAAKPPSNSNSAFGPVKKPSQDSTSAEKSQPPKPYQKDYSTTSKPLQPLRAPYNGNSQSDAVRLAFNSKPSFGKKKGAAVKAPASTAAPEAPPPENEGLLNNDQNSQADTDQRVQPPDNDQNLHQNSNGQNFPQATDEQSVPTPPGELNFQERPRKTNPVEKNRAPAAKPAMPRAGSKPKPKKSYVENPEDTNVSPENVGDGQLDSDQGLNGRDPSSWLDKRNGWQSPPDNENQLSPAASQIEAQPVNKNSRVTKPIEYRRQPSDVLPKAKVGLAKKQKPLVAAQKPSLPGQCAPNSCRTPDCYCGGTMVPAGMDIADVPQMILLSFDAEINERNLPIYEQIFHKNRKNPNGCNIKATFFVSHEFTNYGMVRYLYEKGHEIGSHSITHGVGTGFKGEKAWETEMSGQKGFLASFASIRPDDIKGARAPLLGTGGDDQFEALYNGGFLYDSTLATPTTSKAPYWPFTLDYGVPFSCAAPPCPQRSYKGLWELPLNSITGMFGESCYEADRCTFGSTGNEVYKLLYGNFYDRYYSINKAPFQLTIHADWLKYPPHREAFERFLDVAASMPDVWIVTQSQTVAWMQNPTSISQLNSFAPWQCSADDASRLPQCDTINACPLPFRERLRYFYTCSECPAEFPWKPEV